MTGLVVANWTSKKSDKNVTDVSLDSAAPRVATSPAAPTAVGVPMQSAIEETLRHFGMI